MATLANAHFVDSDINGSTSGTTTWQTTSPNTQDRTITHPANWAHLEGETVQVVEDGTLGADQDVSSGTVTTTGTTNHIGLAYTSTLKPTKLDIEGMGILLVKVITKAIISFYNTLMGKVGTSTTAMETISFGTSLVTDIKEVPLNGGYDRSGDIIITQEEPFPMIVRGMVLDTGAHLK